MVKDNNGVFRFFRYYETFELAVSTELHEFAQYVRVAPL